MNKQDKLFRQLQEAIRNGRFPIGSRIPTERELADDFDCSRVTVRSSLRRLEELNMIERVRGSGTYVLEPPRESQVLCDRVAIFLEGKGAFSDDDPYYSRLFSGLFRNGKISFLPEVHSVRNRDDFPWRSLQRGDFAGLVIGYQMTEAEYSDLCDFGLPFVAMEKPEVDLNVSYVAVDNYAGATIAAQHLLESGYRSPLFLCGSPALHMNRKMIAGFRDTLGKAGIDAEERVLPVVPYDEVRTAVILERELQNRMPFDALLIYGDWAAWSAVNYLRARQIRIPEDIGLVMYDEYSWVSRALKLAISTVRQPHAEQLKAALAMLLRKIRFHDETRVIQTIQPSLIARNSSLKPSRH